MKRVKLTVIVSVLAVSQLAGTPQLQLARTSVGLTDLFEFLASEYVSADSRQNVTRGMLEGAILKKLLGEHANWPGKEQPLVVYVPYRDGISSADRDLAQSLRQLRATVRFVTLPQFEQVSDSGGIVFMIKGESPSAVAEIAKGKRMPCMSRRADWVNKGYAQLGIVLEKDNLRVLGDKAALFDLSLAISPEVVDLIEWL